MPLTKEELQERSLVVRAWEAACEIEHPTDSEIRIREALGKKVG